MSRSPILTRYSESGAVPGPGGFSSAETAWHFGDPLGEQRAAARGVIVVDRSDRAVIELSGDERLSWLHTISSQHVADLPDRRSAENLSLDANGRVEEHFVLTDVDGVTWIDTEGSRGEPLAGFLKKMVFWAKADPVLRPDMRVLTLVGPAAVTGPVADLLEIPADADVYRAGDLPETHHEDEPLGFWRRMPPLGEDRDLPVVDVVVPEFVLLRWWEALAEAGARMAGSWAHEALRVAARRPRLGVDTDERTIPHEVDWIGGPGEEGAVHLDKGCYRGQETVARVHNLGKAPRRLVLLHLDGSTDRRPATGDPVTAGGRAVGRLGTVVDHYEWGPVALALVKRNVGADVDLAAGAEEPVSARIDPDSVREDEHVQAGRAAIERLRSGAAPRDA
ncbi:CAF17-like 4Fe-4S cluster assembly/insertion protein YgfZ [Gordonia paraffinivorans]|uniref:CAF17-like 4Fe-4S cluster assembly/insertion protein YgfZ n=1 Tax=Gordonia paraffinivorans TaxID=175628 RepID=UPI001E485228|nr:folate-binding protein [Gordonia paraffinivorans]MCD2145605.1 folate-binding protein [Gordonia paraffinivorans]